MFKNLDSPISYSSAANLKKESRRKGIPQQDVIKFLQNEPSYYLHKQASKKYDRKKTTGSSFMSHHQADLADMSNIANFNSGYRFILVVVDCFSRMIWAEPLKNKSPVEVKKAFEKIYKIYQPYYLITDKGTEFLGSVMKEFCKKYEITQITPESDVKASMAERYIKTLKHRLYRYFTANNTYQWTNVLQKFVKNINNTMNSSIGCKPSSINFNSKKVSTPPITVQPLFKCGDTVVVSKVRRLFEKSYTGTWNKEFFKISKVVKSAPPSYTLEDLKGEPIIGCFYESELQLASNTTKVYHVQKILSEKYVNGRRKCLVKWRDYDESFNSWVDSADVIYL